MTEHTPGPWESELMADREGDWYEIAAPMVGRTGTVADTLNRDHTIDPDENRANAWLIAAAPELLEACRGLLMCSLPVDVSGRRFVEAARIAIAKATGSDRSPIGRGG